MIYKRYTKFHIKNFRAIFTSDTKISPFRENLSCTCHVPLNIFSSGPTSPKASPNSINVVVNPLSNKAYVGTSPSGPDNVTISNKKLYGKNSYESPSGKRDGGTLRNREGKE